MIENKAANFLLLTMAMQSLQKRIERLEGVVESVVEELGKDAWEKSRDKECDEEEKEGADWWKKKRRFEI